MVKRILGIVGLLVVLALGAAALFGMHTVRASYPQTVGEIEVNGLQAPVTVSRDELGIPHIQAQSLEDLFFTQGYVHAQDRFWEMDVRRHITAGRLSEMFGESQVATDSFIRTLGWRHIAEQEIDLLSERSRRILDAYATGVNAYLADHQGAELSLEYAVLALQNPDYTPEPWVPADSVAWLKALAWDLRGNMEDEIYRAIMSASVGVEQTQELFPPYPYAEHRPIIEGGAVVNGVFDAKATAPAATVGSSAHIPSAAVPALAQAAAVADLLEPWLGTDGPGIGSNSWVVSGEHTVTGKPLLANDPHLAPAMPSLWYQAYLQCATITDDCNYDVSGWTMSGLPGVFIGHNADIAWGFTNLGPDVSDLVLHRLDESTGTYLLDGRQVPLTMHDEVIEVAGGDPVTISVRETVDGPIVSGITDVPEYDAVGADAPVPAPGMRPLATDADRGDGYAVALRWTALTPRNTFDAFDALNTATNWTQFRSAARLLSVPAQNLIFAGVDGTIGYQSPGVIPIRDGYDGTWPVPGWDSSYQWQGFIPFSALPNVTDPDEGWIVTANQAVIDERYPFLLTKDWSYGARSQRIVDLISETIDSGATLDIPRMQVIQMDAQNELATFIVPRLTEVPVPDDAAAAVALLNTWDFQQSMDSAPAAYFNAVWSQLVARMFDAASDTDLIHSSGGDRYWQVIETIWDDPTNAWWDDKTLDGVQTRDETLAASMSAAVQTLSAEQGNDPAAWQWGDAHTLLLQHQVFGDIGIAPIEMLFNRGPIQTSGGEATVNATGWTPSDGFTVDWVPSMRQVIDLSDFDSSTWVNLTGNSGHAYNRNYSDQVDAWRDGTQFAWPFSTDAVHDAAIDTLVLRPAN